MQRPVKDAPFEVNRAQITEYLADSLPADGTDVGELELHNSLEWVLDGIQSDSERTDLILNVG